MKTKTKIKNLETTIKNMKCGDFFEVSTSYEREEVSRVARTLRNAGIISFHVKTFKVETGFKVCAI